MVKKIKKEKVNKKREEISYLEEYLLTFSRHKSKPYDFLKEKINKILIGNDEILKYITNFNLKSLKSENRIEEIGLFVTGKVIDELKFAIAFMSFYKNEISIFLENKKSFEENFYIGNKSEALDALDKMKNNCGYSLWYLENKINFLEIFESSKQQMEYARNIIDDEEHLFFARMMGYYGSYRAQVKSKSDFLFLLYELTDKLKERPLCSYFNYKLNYYDKEWGDEDLILKSELKTSIYDGYEALIRIIQGMLLKEEISDSESKIITIFCKEFVGLDDYRVRKIKELTDKKIQLHNVKIVECFNFYEKGMYDECLSISEEILIKYPMTYEIYDIYINTLIKLKKDFFMKEESIFYNMMKLIKDLKMLKKEPKETIRELDKKILMFSSNSFSTAFLYIKDFILNQYKVNKEYLGMYQLNNIFYDIKNINTQLYKDIYIDLKNEYLDKTIIKLLENFYDGEIKEIDNLSIPCERKIRYKIQFYYSEKNYKKVLDLIKKLNNEEYTSFDFVKNLQILSYLYSNEIERSIELLVDTYLENNNLAMFLPINEIIEVSKKIELDKKIELPIIYHIHHKEKKQIDSFKEFEKYEDFLIYQSKEKPSDLFSIKKIFSTEKLEYFLANVCSIQNMKLSMFFDSEFEVIDERIKICQYLMKKNNNSKYIDEIINLNKQKLIIQGVNQLNDGKINLNIDEIKNIIDENLDKNFSLIKYNLNSGIDLDMDIYEPLFFSQNDVPENKTYETNSQLYRMVIEARNIFILNEKFGLDTCLSTQIRHGIITNALRSIFEDLKLVTKKDRNGNYLLNKYWIDYYDLNIDHEEVKKLLEVLENTSKKIDDLSFEIKNELIQLKTEERSKKNGLFDYNIYLEEVIGWETEIKNIENIGEFSEFIIHMLLHKTQENLQEVREYFREVILSDFVKIINDTLVSINSLKISVPELRTQLNTARQTIQQEIEKIIKWFNLSTKDIISEYDSYFLKEVLLSSIKCRLNIIDTTGLKFKGNTLNSVFHILYNLLLNSLTHSGKDNVECNIEFKEEEENIRIIVSNAIYTNLEKTEEITKIILEKLKNKDQTKINAEGGTGFNKIQNILDNILKIQNKIDVYVDNKIFYVDILLSKKGVLK